MSKASVELNDTMPWSPMEVPLDCAVSVTDAERYARKALKLYKTRESVIAQLKRYLDSIDKKINWLEANIMSFMRSNKQATGASTFTLDGVRLSIRKKTGKWVIRDPEVFHEWCETSIRPSDHPEMFESVLRRPYLMKRLVELGDGTAAFNGEHVPGVEWHEPHKDEVSLSVKETDQPTMDEEEEDDRGN